MGVTVSTPNFIPNNQLLFPPELLDIIFVDLSPRDLSVAREVCKPWLYYVAENGKLGRSMRVQVDDSKVPLQQMALSPVPLFTAFYLNSLDLTRDTISFWNVYSDLITRLEFVDCALPRGADFENNQSQFKLGCPNLKHLGLINMDKYFMMGSVFIDLPDILCLENLESLDFSRNTYLSDRIIFLFLQKTKQLRSLNLASCKLIFFKAVHNRFYPKGTPIGSIDTEYNENILSFRTLISDFICTPKGAKMVELILRDTSVTAEALTMISDTENFCWESIDFRKCNELKVQDCNHFIKLQQNKLKKLVFGNSIERGVRNFPDIFGDNHLLSMVHLSINSCVRITNSKFLALMPNLRVLNLEECNNLEILTEDLLCVPNLEVLNVNSVHVDNQKALSEAISKLNKIVELQLGGCGWVTDEFIQTVIKHLKKLRRLNISRSGVTDKGLAGICISGPDENTNKQRKYSLFELKDLVDLDLSYCLRLGEYSWNTALRLPNLVKLNLTGCTQLTPKGIIEIAFGSPSLEFINILHCGSVLTSQPELITTVKGILYRLRSFVF